MNSTAGYRARMVRPSKDKIMNQKIKVIFEKVYVKAAEDIWGDPEWKFDAKIDGKQVGDPEEEFQAIPRQYIALPRTWSAEVEISGTKVVPVKFKVEEAGGLWDSDVGSRTKELKWPFTEGQRTIENPNFKVFFKVELEVLGEFGHHHGDEVFACRNHAGSQECTTVAGDPAKTRIEVCEVWPVPPAAHMPERLSSPGKPTFKSTNGVKVAHNHPINVLPNPSVIPVLVPGKATKKNAARIQVNFYQPRNLKFKVKDDRLKWSVVNLKGNPKVKFVGKPQGLRVFVYGRAAGEVRLEVRFQGVRLGIYRALVRPIKSIPCRVTILDGGKGARVLSGKTAVYRHVRVANRFFRQAGVQLVLDNDKTTKNAAVWLQRGIFKVNLPAGKKGETRNIGSNFPLASRYNYRLKVLNIVYVHSRVNGAFGTCIARPASKVPVPAGKTYPQLSDEGTPSTSWIEPSGVWPHKPAKKQILELMVEKKDPAGADIWSLVITNACGKKPWLQKPAFRYGNTIAHEVGHALNLCHREATQDLLNHPPDENLMDATAGPVEAQDIDIIQVRAIWKSPIL